MLWKTMTLVTVAAFAASGGTPDPVATSPDEVLYFDALVIEAVEIPFSNAASCGWCATCFDGHDMSASGSKAWHDCIPTACQAHPDCGPSEDDEDNLQEEETMALLIAAVETGDVDAIHGFLDRNPEQLTFNVARRSIQVENCGVLHTNLPMEEATFAGLTQAIQ